VEGWVDPDTAVSVQPVPKAAYRSDFREKHRNSVQRGFHLAPQSDVLTTGPPRPAFYACRLFSVLDFCLLDPCQHGGTCTSITGVGYACACVPGYNGTDCQLSKYRVIIIINFYKKNFRFKTVRNSDTQLKQKKNQKGATTLATRRHNVNVLLSNSIFEFGSFRRRRHTF